MLVILSNIMAIYRKELILFFGSPVAYVVAALFWFLSGVFFVAILLGPLGLIQRANFYDLQVQGGSIDVPYDFLQIYLTLMAGFVLFLMPILSMGLYAEERKRGTLELLATSPITNWSVAVGKLLAVMTFFITIMIPIVGYEAFAFSASNPPFPPQLFFLAHGGLILLAGSILSLGMFISTLTDSTIISAFSTFALVLFLWVLDLIGGNVGGTLGEVLGYLSLLKVYGNMVRGIMNSSAFVLFGSYIILGIYLTAQSVDTLRFQR